MMAIDFMGDLNLYGSASASPFCIVVSGSEERGSPRDAETILITTEGTSVRQPTVRRFVSSFPANDVDKDQSSLGRCSARRPREVACVPRTMCQSRQQRQSSRRSVKLANSSIQGQSAICQIRMIDSRLGH